MYYLEFSQKLPLSLEESWNFFSSLSNLKVLTPGLLGFELPDDVKNSKMYAGQIISYRIRPLWNISLNWVTEITHIHEPYYFIDEQRFGPYKFWHHEHRFNPIPNGIEMIDKIYYKIPFGPIGKILHFLKVQQEIEAIFSYRHAKLENMFGSYSEN